ncbi:hypothetical protein HN51_023209 [Arachis hypogaea]|nr:uncharacterized protein DS421_2g58460 [Arachis hypogaea]
MDDDLLLMVCSGVCSGGSGTTSSYYQSQKLERPVEHTRSSSFWVQRRWFLAKLSKMVFLILENKNILFFYYQSGKVFPFRVMLSLIFTVSWLKPAVLAYIVLNLISFYLQ